MVEPVSKCDCGEVIGPGERICSRCGASVGRLSRRAILWRALALFVAVFLGVPAGIGGTCAGLGTLMAMSHGIEPTLIMLSVTVVCFLLLYLAVMFAVWAFKQW